MTSRNTVYLNLDGLGLRAFHSCIPYPTHFWPNNNFSYHRSNLDIKVTHCAQNIVGKASHETLGLFGFFRRMMPSFVLLEKAFMKRSQQSLFPVE